MTTAKVITTIDVDIPLQVKLRNIRSVDLSERRGYMTVSLEMETGEKLMVRRPENLREWCSSLKRLVMEKKRMMILPAEQFWNKKYSIDHLGVDSNMEKSERERPRSSASLDRRKKRSKFK